jgi:hypothetical protein
MSVYIPNTDPDPEWTVDAKFVERDGHRILWSIRIRPAGGWMKPGEHEISEGGLTAAVLRKVPLADLHAAIDDWISALRELEPGFDLGPLEGFKSHERVRGPSGDLKLAQYAEIYERHRGSRSQMRDAAVEAKLEPIQMRNYIYRARRRGLLTKTSAGRAGGDLTPRARSLLKRESERQQLDDQNRRRTLRPKRRRGKQP